MSKYHCSEIWRCSMRLILKDIEKLAADNGSSFKIISIETVRTTARRIRVRI